MSIPQPPKPLDGHCSTVDNDTLYVLSSTGLQSLPLKVNATWSEEPSGETVTGPVCVNAGPALYVVGGSTTNNQYGGLQRYWFGNKTWETLTPMSNDMKSRTAHSAAYLSDSKSILVYAGSQPIAPSDLSSQTFLVHTSPPYNIESFISNAPPTNAPILLPWDGSHAVMLGGASDNTAVFTFGPELGWQQLGTNLRQALLSSTRATLVHGADGSRVLEAYDVSKSPNQVSQTVLLGANGQTASTGATVGSHSSSRKRKRDLTLGNWPPYNNANAPTAVRADCSVALGSNGLAVIAGGSADAPVALFDQHANGWVDAGKFFNAKHQQPLQPPSTSGGASSSSPSTSSPTTPQQTSDSSSNSGASGLNPHDRMLKTLGITLGVLCGIAAVFILILLFFRWRKLRQKKEGGYIDEKTGNRMSFADRGASFMKEAGGSVSNLLPPTADRNGGAHSSMAIMAGKFGNKRLSSNHMHKASYDSTARLVKGHDGNKIGGEPVEMVDIGGRRPPPPRKNLPIPRTELTPPAAMVINRSPNLDGNDERPRSSGWSKYFATSGPTGPNGVSHLPDAYAKRGTTNNELNYASNPRIPASERVPPLDIDFSRTLDGQRLSRVAKGSPSFLDPREDFSRRGSPSEGQRGFVVDPDQHLRPDSAGGPSRLSGEGLRPKSSGGISGRSLSSYNRSTMGSTLSSNDIYNDSGNPPWTPVTNNFKDSLASRPPSSNYTNSIIEPSYPRQPPRGKSGGGFFPGAGVPPAFQTSSKSRTGHASSPSAEWAAAKDAAGLSFPMPPKGTTGEDRASTLTVFPRGVPSAYYATREKDKAASDMSWLNLGLGNNQHRT